MTRILNASLKKFTGAKYERIPKTLIIWAVVFLALRTAEIRIEISPAVLCFTALCLTVSGFVGVLSSDDIIDSLRGQIMLPESPVKFHVSLFISLVIYTLLTNTGLLLIFYLALSTVSVPAIIGFAICFLVSGAAVYPFAFRYEKKVTAKRHVGGMKHSFIVYLLRYLWNNKNYLVNMLILWAFGCAFSIFMSGTGFPNIFPLGFALMCLNTPIGILLSGDRPLYRQVMLLPGGGMGVLLPYGLFVAFANAAACAVYLIAWYIATGNITLIMIALAALFSAISAALTVTLEIKYPLLNWKVETDLWHHPRKYIVPGIMVAISFIFIIIMGE